MTHIKKTINIINNDEVNDINYWIEKINLFYKHDYKNFYSTNLFKKIPEELLDNYNNLYLLFKKTKITNNHINSKYSENLELTKKLLDDEIIFPLVYQHFDLLKKAIKIRDFYYFMLSYNSEFRQKKFRDELIKENILIIRNFTRNELLNTDINILKIFGLKYPYEVIQLNEKKLLKLSETRKIFSSKDILKIDLESFQYINLFKHLSLNLRNDPEVVNHFKFNRLFDVKYIGKKLLNNISYIKDFYMYSQFLKYANKKILKDKDICVKHLIIFAYNYHYIDDSIKTKDLVLSVLEKNSAIYSMVSEEFKNDYDILIKFFSVEEKYNKFNKPIINHLSKIPINLSNEIQKQLNDLKISKSEENKFIQKFLLQKKLIENNKIFIKENKINKI